jgi:protein TonB
LLLERQNSYRYDRDDNALIGSSEPVFTKAEIEPAYPGGAEKWENYISNNLRYPNQAKSNNVSGTVIVQFIVDKEGRPVNVKAIDGPEELRAEAERLIHEGGKWIPARQNGLIVKAYVQRSIRFQRQ